MPHRKLPRPVLAVLIALAAVVALAAAAPASAGLAKAGPINPQTGFPAWYEDANGVRVEPCVVSVANCFAGGTVPNAGQPFSVPGNSPEELFYYAVDSTMSSANGGTAFLRVALEGGFASASGGPEAGKQAVFARVRVRVDNLVAGEDYVITHPWGTLTLKAASSGVRSINFTDDIGCPVAAGSPPCDFNLPLTGAVGPFFAWDTGAPAGFLGSFATPHAITGAPLGANVFRITGKDVGGPGINTIETDQFQLSAKVAGALIATPANFGLQRVGAGASAPQTITITNTSPTDVALGAAAIAGGNAADFAVTADGCSTTTVAAGDSCTMKLTFTPGAAGDRLASLSFAGDDMSVLLDGTGTAPALAFTPAPFTSVAFGSVRVGTKAQDVVTISNTGLAPMTVTGATLTGANASEFTLTNGCLALAVPAGGSCTIAVDFAPSSTGAKTATLEVTDDAAGSPHTLPVTGFGTAPSIVLSGTSLVFAPQNVGTMSSAQVLSVGNSGSTTLIVGSVSVGGAAASDFHASGCAGANVAPGSSCAVNIRFAPTGEGTREATLTIADDTGAARTVSLQGMGLGTSQVPVQQVPVQQVTPQPAVPAVAKPALLAGPAAVRAKRVGRTVVVRVSLSLGEPAAVDVSALRGAKRFTLLKGSRVGAYRTNARSRTIAAGVDVAGPLAVELRLPAGEVRKGRLYRIVVHARGSAGAAASLTTTFRL